MAKNEWTAKRIKDLTDLYTDTIFSFGQMTVVLNEKWGTTFSRNALIGKVSRIGILDKRPQRNPTFSVSGQARKEGSGRDAGLSHRLSTKRIGQTVVRSSRPRSVPTPGSAIPSAPEISALDGYGSRDDVVPVNGVEGIAIDALDSHTCRWPLGGALEKPPYRYCGKRVFKCDDASIKTPYCLEHFQRGKSNRNWGMEKVS